MELDEKIRRMSEWSEGVKDGCIEFLEIALEMKEGGKTGYEWPWLIGLYLDMFAKSISTGISSCAPDLDTKLKTRMRVARITASRGYNSHFKEMAAHISVEEINAFESMNEIFIELWNRMPGSSEDEKEINSILSSAPQQQELPIDTEVIV